MRYTVPLNSLKTECACFAAILDRVDDGYVAGKIVMSFISEDHDKIQKAINEAMLSEIYK